MTDEERKQAYMRFMAAYIQATSFAGMSKNQIIDMVANGVMVAYKATYQMEREFS